MPKKQPITEIDILKIYRNTGMYATDDAFASDLFVSKQRLSQWLNGTHTPDLNWLKLMAIINRDNWRGMLAVELLKARGLEDEIPCVCVDEVDKLCPKHGDGIKKIRKEEVV